MSMFIPVLSELLRNAEVATYLLRAHFNADDQGYVDTQVLDTEAEGVSDGQLTVVEISGTLAIVSNKYAFTPANGWNQLGVYSQAVTKALGRGLVTTVNLDATDTRAVVAWVDSADVDIRAVAGNRYYVYASIDGNLDIAGGGVATGDVVAYSASTDYQIAIVLGGYSAASGVPWRSGQAAASYLFGAAFFIKGGAFTTWTLLFRSSEDNTATLYAVLTNYTASGTFDDFRVPVVDLSAVLQPTCLSTFTADNGTSLDAITPEVGGAWTEQAGDWDIQANRANPDGAAIATVDSGLDDVLVDCIVNGGTGDQPAIVLRYSGGDYWYLQADRANNQLELHEYNATVDTVRASAAVTFNDSTDYDLRALADAQTIDGFADAGNKISYASAALNESVTVHGIRAENTAGQFVNFAIYPRTATIFDTTLDAV